MMAKYSGVEKVSAMLAMGCASVTMTAADSRPPNKAETRVQPSATAARPLRAIV
jgi:hypothetical protein